MRMAAMSPSKTSEIPLAPAALYLMQENDMTAAEVSDRRYHDLGFLGVSGISEDMRVLLARDRSSALQAIALFVHRNKHELDSIGSALGRSDALVFTGGIGEHASEIRRLVCDGMAWLGLYLDQRANAARGSRNREP